MKSKYDPGVSYEIQWIARPGVWAVRCHAETPGEARNELRNIQEDWPSDTLRIVKVTRKVIPSKVEL